MLSHLVRTARIARCSAVAVAPQLSACRPDLPATPGAAIGRVARCSSSASGDAPARTVNLQSTRGVLRLSGEDVYTFLQGLVSHDVMPLQGGAIPARYCHMLNPKGRFVHELYLHSDATAPAIVFAEVDRESLGPLKRALTRYRLRAAVDIADVSEELSPWARFPGAAPPEEPSHPMWHTDARGAWIGHRGLFPPDAAPVETPPEAAATPQDYLEWRYQQGLPEGDLETPSGSALPLEYNLDGLHGVAFDKGCYVGQELVARTHFQGLIRKRCMPIVVTGDARDIQPGASMTLEGVQRAVGKVTAVSPSGRGLAVVRLESAAAVLQRPGSCFTLGDGAATAQVRIPQWWPQEWVAAATSGEL